MQTALKLNTTVLPGHRIEITDPDLPEGANVEVVVALPSGLGETDAVQRFATLAARAAASPFDAP